MIPKVNIFTNLPQRDKHKDERLAEELRDLGFEVWVTDFLPGNRQQVLYYKPHIIVLPEARCEYTIDFAEQCREWGIRVVVRRCEAGAAKEAYDKMEHDEKQTVIGAWDYGKAVDLEIVWSEAFRKICIKDGYLPPEKIYAAGAFSFDPYFEKRRDPAYRNKPNILFAPGWGHADRSPDYNIPEAPPGSSLHRDAWTRHNNGRAKWVSMIRRVAKELGDSANYFISCKTGELPIAYQNTVGKWAKLVMPVQTPVLLANADLVIHPGSTMGISAHLWDIPALSYYGNINQVEGYDYPHVSPNFEDEDDLIKAIKSIQFKILFDKKAGKKVIVGKSNANISNMRKLSKEFYGKIDGMASKRAAKEIAKLKINWDVSDKIPMIWPDSKREFYTPGILKHAASWKCECCGKIAVADIKHEMIKCPWCGISLARKLEGNKVIIRPTNIPDVH